jgi:transposase
MGRSTTSKSKVKAESAIDNPNPAKFAGIDFHKKLSVVTLGDQTGKQIGTAHTLMNNENDVQVFFMSHAPLVCAIENCRGNEWFVDLVKSCGHEVRVANTHAVRLIAQSTKKNDKIDSRILMELVSRDYLPTTYQPTQEERALREKLRWRTKLMKSRTQYKNVAHAILDTENKSSQLRSAIQRYRLDENSGLSENRHQQLQKCLEVIDYFEQSVCDMDRTLGKLAKENPDVQRLMTIPGVGELSGLVLFAELGDINRFKNARHVSGYLGMVPRLYASSDVRKLGRITKQGPGHVRRILVQDAWHAVRTSKVFRDKYNKILKRRGKKPAIVAIARTIAEIAYHLLKDKTVFEEKKLTLG